jgi:hypothetical protein
VILCDIIIIFCLAEPGPLSQLTNLAQCYVDSMNTEGAARERSFMAIIDFEGVTHIFPFLIGYSNPSTGQDMCLEET